MGAPFAKAEKMVRMGNPEPTLISTSHVQRANLSMRMAMRCFTRLTNAFSRKRRTKCTRSASTSWFITA
jgi:hypothetical protein